MSRVNGFLQHRRGIWEHVRDGRLTLQDVAVHQYIASQADTRSGVWNGSAGALAGELCISDRMARRFLGRLSRKDYIKRFPTPGKHVCYPIGVHKFTVTDGPHRGEQLDAVNSTSSMNWRYVKPEWGELEGEQRGEQVSSQKRKRIETEKKPSAKPAPPADSRFTPFLDFAFKAFEQKHGQKPTWRGKDFKTLSAMLASNRALEPAELERRFRNYLGSTEPFTQKQGDSLAYFCAHTDSFLAGPIMAVQGKGTLAPALA